MRTAEAKRTTQRATVPVYDFDTDAILERVIRDPLAVLLGRSTLSVQGEVVGADPYNHPGRLFHAARRR